MVSYDSDKTRSLASTAPLYEITSKHTELVAHWHRQPQPPYTYCPYRRPFESLVRSCFDPNQLLLRELIPTVDFPNGQTFPPRGRRRVPQSPVQIASDAGLAFSFKRSVDYTRRFSQISVSTAITTAYKSAFTTEPSGLRLTVAAVLAFYTPAL